MSKAGTPLLTEEDEQFLAAAIQRGRVLAAAVGPSPLLDDDTPSSTEQVVPYAGDPHNGQPHPEGCTCEACNNKTQAHPVGCGCHACMNTSTSCWHDDTRFAVAGDAAELVRDARAVRKELVRMLAAEAQEDLSGKHRETWDMLSLAQAISYVDQFIGNEAYEMIAEASDEKEVAIAADPTLPKTVRFRCGDCGKYMRLRPANRRLRATGGTSMAGQTFTLDPETLARVVAKATAEAVAMVFATMVPGKTGGGDVENDTGPDVGAAGLEPDNDMSPRDTDTKESPPAIPTKAGMAPAPIRSADLQPDNDMSPRDTDTAESPGVIPTKADLQPDNDMSPRDTDTAESPGVIPTKAGMTVVLHDSGPDAQPAQVHQSPSAPEAPPRPAPQPGQGPPENMQPKNNSGDDSAPPKPEDDQSRPPENEEDPNDPNKKKSPFPPKAQAALTGGDADAAQAALEEDARESGARAFGQNGNVRRSYLPTEEGNNAWLADLEKQAAVATRYLQTLPPQDGTSGRAVATLGRSPKVAIASQDVPGDLPDIDLSALFAR